MEDHIAPYIKQGYAHNHDNTEEAKKGDNKMTYGKPLIQFANPLKDCVAIIGMRQEGKTNLLKWLLNSTRNPYTVFDTLGQVSKGFKPLDPKTQKIFHPSWDRRYIDFDQTCKDVWKEGNQILAIDEVSVFCNKWEMPEPLNRLISMGGNRNIAVWITTQRVAQVHNNILANCQYHFIFRTYLPQDIEWYSKFVPKEIILMSKDLPRYHFIYYQLGREPVICKPVKLME